MRTFYAILAVLFLCPSLAWGERAPESATYLHYDSGHGTQVEYLGDDGMSYLWYPGNKVVLSAPWKVVKGNMCFLYGVNTYNPVTKELGGQWECNPLAIYLKSITQHAQGDVFDLSKGRAVPFVLSRKRTDLRKLYEEYERRRK